MAHVTFDQDGKVSGVHSLPGSSTVEIADDDPRLLARLNWLEQQAQTEPRDLAAELDDLKAVLIGKNVVTEQEIAAKRAP